MTETGGADAACTGFGYMLGWRRSGSGEWGVGSVRVRVVLAVFFLSLKGYLCIYFGLVSPRARAQPVDLSFCLNVEENGCTAPAISEP